MNGSSVRLADVLASLALAIDLGLGVPFQTIHRTTLVGVRLARAAGMGHADVAATYWTAMLRYVGCTTTSHATSQMVDEMALGDLLVVADDEVLPYLERMFARTLAADEARAAARTIASAFAAPEMGPHHRNHCEAAELIAKRLELGPRVSDALTHAYERWDGLSTQRLAEGEGISLPMRVVQVAWQVGQDSVTREPADIARRVVARAGRSLDPSLAALVAADPAHFVEGFDEPDLTQQVLGAEPGGPICVSGDRIDRALSCIADFGDLKSPHMIGHSRRVAGVVRQAASAASMPTPEVDLVARAALVHDVGRVGLQSSLLSKSGPLSRAEHERIRLHSYFTERIFADNHVLAPVGTLGAAHHERLDGSGYHRGLQASGLSSLARLLTAANTWCAMTEARPHRRQFSGSEAANALATQAREGLLDRNAVDAVLTATGQKGSQTRRASSLDLTQREAEVLRLVAREMTNPAIGDALGISPKTVERHVTHIYQKIGVSSRAGAAIHALENGLI